MALLGFLGTSLTLSSYQPSQLKYLDGLFVIAQLYLNIRTWTEDDLYLLDVQAIDGLLVLFSSCNKVV
jgi:hypothetical protein